MESVNYVVEMPTSGETKINVDTLIGVWEDPRFWLAQWHDEFQLIESVGNETFSKMTIATDVAISLIRELNLIKTPNRLFRNAASWRQAYGER